MKLVVLSGPIRGKVLDLAPGNNFIGRAEENSITLPSGQVSRRHACLSLVGDNAYLEDLGSSNGTFVEEQKIQQKVALRPGSRFRIGEFLLELSVDGRPSNAPLPGTATRLPHQQGPAKSSPRAMPVVLQTHQAEDPPFWRFYRAIAFLGWRGQMVLGALLAVLIIAGLGIYPLLRDEQKTLTQEVLKRGKVLVNRLAMRNGEFIKTRLETNLDTAQILGEEGILEAYLLSRQLMVLSPVEQRGRTMNRRAVCVKAIQSGDVVVASEDELGIGERREGVFHIAAPIRVWAEDQGLYRTYGVAYIVMDARRIAEANAKSPAKFLAVGSVILAGVGLLLVAVFLLTNRPIQALADDGELVLRGDLRTVQSRAKWKELNAVAHTLNRSFDRYHQAATASAAANIDAVGPSFVSPATSGTDKDDGKIAVLADAVSEGVMITDDMQRVVHVNQRAASILGTTLQTAKGRHIMEAIGNQELLGEVLDLLRQLVASDDGRAQTTVHVQGPDGPLELKIVAAGVRNPQSGQLSHAAIVLR